MSEPKVSILLPIYNGERTLASTVDSLLKQTFSNFVILACIDGTHDQSESILTKFDDSRIIIIKNSQNLGLARTLNRLMHLISNDTLFVAMAEQDDWYYPDRLQQQVDFLINNDDYGLVSGIAEHWMGNGDPVSLFPGILENGRQYPQTAEEFIRYNYRHQIKVVNTCMMFKLSTFRDNGMYFSAHYPNVSVDWSFVLRFGRFAKVHGLHKVLVRMDRTIDRISITKNLSKQYQATHELLSCFRYEFPEITHEDYKYAKVTQYILEQEGYKFILGLGLLFRALSYGPLDKRVWRAMRKRMARVFR